METSTSTLEPVNPDAAGQLSAEMPVVLEEAEQSQEDPGVARFNQFRKTHGLEVCPGDACATHSGHLALQTGAQVELSE